MVPGVALESRVGNPRNVGVVFEPAGEFEGVGGLPLDPKREGLETLEQQE